eukprot:6055-Heterococcus_DN1.PRE.1
MLQEKVTGRHFYDIIQISGSSSIEPFRFFSVIKLAFHPVWLLLHYISDHIGTDTDLLKIDEDKESRIFRFGRSKPTAASSSSVWTIMLEGAGRGLFSPALITTGVDSTGSASESSASLEEACNTCPALIQKATLLGLTHKDAPPLSTWTEHDAPHAAMLLYTAMMMKALASRVKSSVQWTLHNGVYTSDKVKLRNLFEQGDFKLYCERAK